MIYLDNHATTRCDPQGGRCDAAMVVGALWQSRTVAMKRARLAAEAIERAIAEIATLLERRTNDAVVITSGATESNNLAIRGFCTHPATEASPHRHGDHRASSRAWMSRRILKAKDFA